MSFALESGVDRVFEHFRDLLDRGGQLRILTGDYLGITEPNALMRLLDLEGNVERRVFETATVQAVPAIGPLPVRSFHPKAYIFGDAGVGTAFVGSSNLSASALTSAVEWNYRILSSRDGAGYADTVAAFNELFRHPCTKDLTAEWVATYRARRPLQASDYRSRGRRSGSAKAASHTDHRAASGTRRAGADPSSREQGRPGRPRNGSRKDMALGFRHQPSRVSPCAVRGAPRGNLEPGSGHIPAHPTGGPPWPLHRRYEGSRRRRRVCFHPDAEPARASGAVLAQTRSTT